MGEEIFTFLRESKYSVSLITVPFCPVAPCPFQILAGVLGYIPTRANRGKVRFLLIANRWLWSVPRNIFITEEIWYSEHWTKSKLLESRLCVVRKKNGVQYYLLFRYSVRLTRDVPDMKIFDWCMQMNRNRKTSGQTFFIPNNVSCCCCAASLPFFHLSTIKLLGASLLGVAEKFHITRMNCWMIILSFYYTIDNASPLIWELSVYLYNLSIYTTLLAHLMINPLFTRWCKHCWIPRDE